MIVTVDVLEMLQLHLQVMGLPYDCSGASSGRAGFRRALMQDVARLDYRFQKMSLTKGGDSISS